MALDATIPSWWMVFRSLVAVDTYIRVRRELAGATFLLARFALRMATRFTSLPACV
jgi:hypothetical protein